MMNMVDKNLYDATTQTRRRWEARYGEGNTPWDTGITPPEVIDFWSRASLDQRGIALDLGCGPGTNVRYLAQLGLSAIGVEIAGSPLLTAQERIHFQAPSVTGKANFVCSDVCMLPFNGLNATYILDIGCFHSLPRRVRPYYARGVIQNLAPSGYYHLYAFDADPANPEPESGPPGLMEGEVVNYFLPHLELIEETIARPDRRPCRWYLLHAPNIQP